MDYKRRRKINRIKRRICLLCLILAGLACFALFAPMFGVRRVEVSGNQLVSEQEITAASDIYLGRNIFRISDKSVKNNIAKIPYIKEATIRRLLPDGVRLSVTERRPIAYIKNNEAYIYIDEEGYALEMAYAPPEGVVTELAGVEVPMVGERILKNNSANFQKYLETIAQIVHNELTDSVNSIDMHDGARVTIRVNRLEVDFGSGDRIEYKFNMLISIMQKLGANPHGRLDLSNGEKSFYTEN